jgi:hypothetical protein
MKTSRHNRLSSAIGKGLESLETRQLFAVAEPNGSFDIASVDSNNIYAEQPYNNSDSVASYDPDDYYKFYNLYGKSNLYAVVNGMSSDVDLYVYDQNKNLIGQSRNGGTTSELLNVNLNGNQYFFVRVNKYGGGSTAYNLHLQNDYAGSTLEGARDIGVAWGQTSDKFEAYNKIFYGDYLDYRDNVDIVKFKMEAPGTVSLRRLNVSPDNLEGNMQLLNASGSVLRTEYGSSTSGFNLRDYPVPAGTYYVKFNQTSGAGTYSFRITADYAGTTTATSRDLGDLTGSSREMHDMTGSFSSGVASYDDETDLFKFKLTKAGVVDFSLNFNTTMFPTPTFGTKFGLAQDSNFNGFIDAGEYLTSFSNNGKTSVALNPGTYYAVVSENGAYTSYTLNMDQDPDAVAGDPKAWENLSKAPNLGTLAGESSLSGGFGISAGDFRDYYKFSMATAGHLTASAMLNPVYSRSTDAPQMLVLRDDNNNGRFDYNLGEHWTSFKSGVFSEDLFAGNWYLAVAGSGGQSAYDLRMMADYAGNTLSEARAFKAPSTTAQTFNDYVEQNFGADSDANDYYSFALGGTATVNLKTTGVAGEDIALQLIQDKNNNGKIDSGEILAASDKLDSPAESISKSLSAGKYFARVFGVNGGTNYSISLSTGSAPTTTPASDPDDTIGEVKNSTKNTKKIGEFADFTLESKTDVDLIKFVAKAGDRVGFQTESRGGSKINTFVRLFDASGKQIASNNDGSWLNVDPTTKFSFLEYNFSKAGTFYVGVSLNPNKAYNITTGGGDVAGTTTGAYRLRVLNTAPQIVVSSPFGSSPVKGDTGNGLTI